MTYNYWLLLQIHVTINLRQFISSFLGFIEVAFVKWTWVPSLDAHGFVELELNHKTHKVSKKNTMYQSELLKKNIK